MRAVDPLTHDERQLLAPEEGRTAEIARADIKLMKVNSMSCLRLTQNIDDRTSHPNISIPQHPRHALINCVFLISRNFPN